MQAKRGYLAWVLRELAAQDACKSAMLAAGAPAALSSLLADKHVPITPTSWRCDASMIAKPSLC